MAEGALAAPGLAVARTVLGVAIFPVVVVGIGMLSVEVAGGTADRVRAATAVAAPPAWDLEVGALAVAEAAVVGVAGE